MGGGRGATCETDLSRARSSARRVRYERFVEQSGRENLPRQYRKDHRNGKSGQQRMSDPSHCALSVQRKGEIRAQPRTHLPYVAKYFGGLCGEKHTRRGVREPVRGRARYARNEKLLRSGGKQRQPSQRFYSPLLCDEYTERDIRF